ncbi:MAG: hypothetical protein WCQ11_03170, partial [Actinomycetes bacterium]
TFDHNDDVELANTSAEAGFEDLAMVDQIESALEILETQNLEADESAQAMADFYDDDEDSE